MKPSLRKQTYKEAGRRAFYAGKSASDCPPDMRGDIEWWLQGWWSAYYEHQRASPGVDSEADDPQAAHYHALRAMTYRRRAFALLAKLRKERAHTQGNRDHLAGLAQSLIKRNDQLLAENTRLARLAAERGEECDAMQGELDTLRAHVLARGAEIERLRAVEAAARMMWERIETNEEGWDKLGQKGWAAFFEYEEMESVAQVLKAYDAALEGKR